MVVSSNIPAMTGNSGKLILATIGVIFASSQSLADTVGFSGDFAPANWTFSKSPGGNGSVDTTSAPTSIKLTGSDSGSSSSKLTNYRIAAPSNGTVSFSWSYVSRDFSGVGYDNPNFYNNGTLSIVSGFNILGATTQNGVASYVVTSGNIFGFTMDSVDDTGGSADMIFSSFLFSVPGPDAVNTTLAMIANQNALRSLLSQRSSAMMNMTDYDCATFDAKGYCVSFRARYTAMDSQNEGAGVFTAAYRVNEKVRLGAFIDYRASEKDSTGLKQGDTMPTFGAFAAYSHSGDATGFQAKASAAYNSGKVKVTRAGSVADNTEAGSGDARLNSYSIGAELAWGFAVSPTMLATPYAGVRYSDATRNSYTEGTVAGTVDYPISYDAYYQRLTTATAGIRLTGMLSDEVGYQASLGGEYDLDHKASTYSGTSTIPGLETFSLANTGASNRARIVASTGVYYQLDKTQRLTATLGVRGQAYSSQSVDFHEELTRDFH